MSNPSKDIINSFKTPVGVTQRYLNTGKVTRPKQIALDNALFPARDVILSIKPVYSNSIISGRKTVELRRRFPMDIPQGTIAYIYSTTPVRAIVGYAEIADVLKMPVEQIWDDYAQVACIEKMDFDSYFEGVTHGFVLCFKDAHALKREIDLNELRERYDFIPPQSFLYATGLLQKGLKNERTIISNYKKTLAKHKTPCNVFPVI